VTEVETLLADVPADHLRTLIQSAPVWRTPTAVVSDETIERLTTASVDAPLAALVLTLAHINRGEHERARETISRLLAKVPTHAAALAMSAALDKTGQSGAMPAVPKPGAKVGTPAGDVVGQTPADEAGGTDRTVDAASRGSEKSDKGLSVERLIDRGCEEVESGNATQGINLLRKAQEKRPKDVDVLVCLGEGHKRLGTHSKALNFFESALAVSPRYGAALRGAARAAKASGDKKKALDYYQRVLEQEPRNAEARQYVKENG
jgi:tetratricopeptide (TPR) repeat protein